MTVRRDRVFISSVLLSMALLFVVPASLRLFSSGTSETTLTKPDVLWGRVPMGHYLGVASLAIVFIGLIVVWTAYAKRSRSAWFVMLAVAWFWIFSLFVLPALKSFPDWVFDVVSTQIRSGAQWAVIFFLMLVALLLPFKSFFLVRDTSAQIDGRLHKLIRRSAVTLLLVVPLALLVGIHVQVYEIPPEQLNAWRVPATSPVLTVDQVLAAPQAYSHRLITIRGGLVFADERQVLTGSKAIEDIWIESAQLTESLAKIRRFKEQLLLKNKEPLHLNKEEIRSLREQLLEEKHWSEPVLVLPFDEAKDRLAWRKLDPNKLSVVALIGQFETTASNGGKGERRGFGDRGQYTHELILEDVLVVEPTPK